MRLRLCVLQSLACENNISHLDAGHVVAALVDLVEVAHLADEHLGRVGLLAHRDGDLRVIEDGLVDHTHLVPVQPLDHLVVHHAGVDAGLDL